VVAALSKLGNESATPYLGPDALKPSCLEPGLAAVPSGTQAHAHQIGDSDRAFAHIIEPIADLDAALNAISVYRIESPFTSIA
jgi:hypothetical protein